MSKTFSVAMVMVMVTTTTSAARMLGIVTFQNICHAVAPSSRAASMISVGDRLDRGGEDDHREAGLDPDHDDHQEEGVARRAR